MVSLIPADSNDFGEDKGCVRQNDRTLLKGNRSFSTSGSVFLDLITGVDCKSTTSKHQFYLLPRHFYSSNNRYQKRVRGPVPGSNKQQRNNTESKRIYLLN